MPTFLIVLALLSPGAAFAFHDTRAPGIGWTLEPWLLGLLGASAIGYGLGVRALWHKAGAGRGIRKAHVTSFGFLTVGGIVCTVLGAVMLFDSPIPALRVSLTVAVPLAVVTTVFFAVAVGLSIRTMRTKPVTGREGMIGARGTARTALAPAGTVDVHGELWQAVADPPVAAGEPVEVIGIDGLRLRVRGGAGPFERT